MSQVESAVRWQNTDDGANHPTREFIAESDTGRTRTGALWLPDETKSPSLVAFGHGASGDRYQAPIPYLAGRFVRAGHTVVSIDGPVHGLRQIGPGGREAFGEEMRRDSMIDDMNADWRFAIDIARSESPIELTKMAYFGLSMGSIFGIPMLADSARELPVEVATLGLLGSQGIGSRLGARTLKDAAKLTFPILFLMQLEDELFSREGYLELFDAFASSDKRIHANPGLHPEVPPEEMRFAFDFMQKHLDS